MLPKQKQVNKLRYQIVVDHNSSKYDWTSTSFTVQSETTGLNQLQWYKTHKTMLSTENQKMWLSFEIIGQNKLNIVTQTDKLLKPMSIVNWNRCNL